MNPKQSSAQRALILSGGGARGAYQVGVWQRLQEIGWKPDLVCGSSIGSINGALIGMGWNALKMATFWESLHRKQVFRVSFWRRIKYRLAILFGMHPAWPALLDNRLLHNLLSEVIDESRLRAGSPELVVTATNVCHAELHYFSSHELTAEHILASCSIPVLFPWTKLNGELYWDGGIMANTPVLPAIERGVREIVVVLLAPLTGEPVPPPKNTSEAFAWTLDLITIASANTLRSYIAHHLGLDSRQSADTLSNKHFIDFGDIKIGVIAPHNAFGLESFLAVNPQTSKDRIASGYRDASEQLTTFLEMTGKTEKSEITSPTPTQTKRPDI